MQIIDAFSDALNQDNFLLRTIVYAFPVFLCANLYLSNNMVVFYFLGFITLLLLLALLSCGIYNISNNKREILTFNALLLFIIIIKIFFVLFLYSIILFIIGFLLIKYIHIPLGNQYVQIFYKYFVIYFLFSVGFTPYLAFSKKLEVKEAYKFSLIQDSSMDVLMALLFSIPQFLIVNIVLVGSAWYIFFVFNLPLTNPVFVFYCSAIVILNISALSSYLAQMAYTCIKGEDDDYRDKYYIKDNKIESADDNK